MVLKKLLFLKHKPFFPSENLSCWQMAYMHHSSPRWIIFSLREPASYNVCYHRNMVANLKNTLHLDYSCSWTYLAFPWKCVLGRERKLRNGAEDLNPLIILSNFLGCWYCLLHWYLLNMRDVVTCWTDIPLSSLSTCSDLIADSTGPYIAGSSLLKMGNSWKIFILLDC